MLQFNRQWDLSSAGIEVDCMVVVNLGFYGWLYHLKTNEPHLLSFPAARQYPYMSELLVAFLMTVYIKGWCQCSNC